MKATSQIVDAKNRIRIDDLVCVSIATLVPLVDFDVDLYMLANDGKTPLLYRGHGYECSDNDFESLRGKGIEHLFITQHDHLLYQQSLREKLEMIIELDDLPCEDRFAILQNAMASELEHGFRLIKPEAAVAHAQYTGKMLTRLFAESATLPSEMFDVMSQDYSQFKHAINVGTYSLLLAREIGFRDPKDLEAIAIGGMLHDVGKRRIPKKIVKKRGLRTKREQALLRFHPQIGFEETNGRIDLKWGQRMMIYQHHEAIDGSGYPVGIRGDEIHPWAKICAITDKFESKTVKRAKQKSMRVPDALASVQKMAGKKLDEEFTKCWIKIMQPN